MKYFKQNIYISIQLACTYSHVACSCIPLHVENVDQEYVIAEGAVEAEDQEGQPLQEVEDQVEEQDPADLANPDQQPGKHRFIYPRVFHKFKFGASTGSINPMSYLNLKFQSYLICLCIKLIVDVVAPRMHVVGLIYPILDNSPIIITIGSNALLSAIGSIEVECF